MTLRRTYELHGLGIGLHTDSEPWAEAVDEILGPYRVDAVGSFAVEAWLGPAGDARPSASASEVGRFEDLVFHRDGDRLWVDVHGAGWVELDLPARRIHARLELDPRRDAWVVAHHALYPALLEFLKDHGLFPAHSGAVARDGEGLLLCGRSGSGKTTLTLALAHAGWELLSDDTCFLQERKKGEIHCRAFWEDVHVTPETIRRFPQLGFLAAQPLRHANHKKHFRLSDLTSIRTADRCRPRWLVFPSVDREADGSRITPISGLQALEILTPQSLIPLRPDTTELHLRHLAGLVGQVQARKLVMGPDLDEVVSTLSRDLH